MRIPVALLLLLGVSACAVPGDNRPSTITYEKLVQPFPRREPLHCYAAGRKPFPVLSYGECVSKHGTMVSGYGEQWLEENWRWFQVRGWERLTREARRISKELADSGLDPNSREFTAELTRRVTAYRKAHPEVVPTSGKGKKSKKRGTA